MRYRREVAQGGICCGHTLMVITSTTGLAANLVGLGRRAAAIAARYAPTGRYRSRPPPATTSRLTVDGARPNRDAIARIDSPAPNPTRISIRSSNPKRRPPGGPSMSRRITPPKGRNTLTIDPNDTGTDISLRICRCDKPFDAHRITSRRTSGVNLVPPPTLPAISTSLIEPLTSSIKPPVARTP